MQGAIGDKIGEGATADIHAWAPGQVLKLHKPGVPRRLGPHEARMTQAVFLAGGPAPEVLDTVTIEGRFGIVLPRLDGPSLLQLSQTGAMSHVETGAVVATLARSSHLTPAPPEVYTLDQTLAGLMQADRAALPAHVATSILAYARSLPAGNALCHADLHPGNVIMTTNGPRLIDWIGAVRAAPAFDLAVTHVMLSELVPLLVEDPERPRAVNAALQGRYAELAGLVPMAAAAAVAAYLPVARAFALLTGSWSEHRSRIIAGIEASLSLTG
jgi:Ser/Thr protein kinase RdoA (MazF antagonist)